MTTMKKTRQKMAKEYRHLFGFSWAHSHRCARRGGVYLWEAEDKEALKKLPVVKDVTFFDKETEEYHSKTTFVSKKGTLVTFYDFAY